MRYLEATSGGQEWGNGLHSLHKPPGEVVNPAMIDLREDQEIDRPVVSLVAVNVVCLFPPLIPR